MGKTVTRKIGANETVIETRLAGGSAFGPSALLEADAIAFALPIDANTPTLKVGDKVELFAPAEVVTTASRGSGPAVNLTLRSTVVDVNDRAIMIGVSPAESGVVARALLAGAVIIALAN